MKNKTLFISIIISILFVFLCSTQGHTEKLCGKDLNSDDFFDSNELNACIGTDNNLCPFDATDCVSTFSEPICPPGLTLNTATDKCEAMPNISCASGYTYDSALDKCVMVPTCPSGGILNPVRDLCEIVLTDGSCPSGFTYSSVYDACIKDVTCSNGGVYNPTRDQCEIVATYSCISGYTYNPSRQRCEKTPECPSGFTYSTTYNLCLKTAYVSCPSGYSYNSSTKLCEKSPPDCPSGGSYNTGNNRCEVNATLNCPPGGWWDGSKCVAPVTITCDSGYSWDGGNCVRSADCPNGWLNSQYNVCIGNNRYYNCPSGGSWNGSYCQTSSSTYYTCSYNGATYGDYNSCTSNCYRYPGCSGSVGSYNLAGCVGGSTSTGNWGELYGNGTNSYCLYDAVSGVSQCKNYSGPGSVGCFTKAVYAIYFEIYERDGKPCLTIWDLGTARNFGCINVTSNYIYTCSLTGNSYGDYNTCYYNCVQYYGCSTNNSCPSNYWWNGSTCQGNLISITCDSGYSWDGGNCVASPGCPNGWYNNDYDVCIGNNRYYNCPSGYSWNGSQCVGSYWYSCPSGYSLSGSLCIANASCPSGGSLDPNRDICYINPTYYCDSGYTYDSVIGACISSAICSGGALDGNIDVCYTNRINNCPSGYTYNSSLDLCQSPAQCPLGTFDPNIDKCKISAATLCPSGYTFNSSLDRCELAPPCPSEAPYSTTVDKCVRDAIHDCPLSTAYNIFTRLCEAIPTCSAGSYDFSQHKCFEGYNTCPLGNYLCINNGNNKNQCSPYPCVDVAKQENWEITNVDDRMLEDDGPRDQQGNCLGEIYIFSGRGMTCKKAGYDSGWTNCCTSGQAVYKDSTGSIGLGISAAKTVLHTYRMGQIAYYALKLGPDLCPVGVNSAVAEALHVFQQTGSIMEAFQSYSLATFLNPTSLAITAAIYLASEVLLSGSCSQQDVETAMLNSSGMCHYLGEYCSRKIMFVGCVQKEKAFCCFNSKLARIIHEQGRPQINLSWGVAQSPNCRGFTAAEFQSLDFSKIDLSEYFGEITTRMQGEIIENAQQNIQNFYNQTR